MMDGYNINSLNNFNNNIYINIINLSYSNTE